MLVSGAAPIKEPTKVACRADWDTVVAAGVELDVIHYHPGCFNLYLELTFGLEVD